MATSSGIINVNGKQYDAISGKLLGSKPSIAKVGRAMDGIVKAKPSGKALAKISPSSIVHKKVQRSQTLMRKAVPKPVKKATITGLAPMAASKTASAVNNSFNQVKNTLTRADELSRLNRSKQIHKSVKVSRFGGAVNTDIKAGPASSGPVSGEIVSRSAIAPAASISAPVSKPLPSMITSATHGNLEELVNEALAHAKAHENSPHRTRDRFGLTRKSKLVGAAVFAFVVVLAGSVFAYQKVPSVAVKIVTKQAGIKALAPTYKPAGFAFKGAAAVNDGVVNLRYTANADSGRTYTISQRKSDWDSASLLSNFVSTNGNQYQTFLDHGKTIFVYDGQNATWVNQGIWYNVESNADLNTEQLLKIAASM